MADTAAAVNGVYASQYGQPVELAASTPSASSHVASAPEPTATSTAAQKADPTEIGWYFVEQYYTTLSKSPERIHLFYSKKSQLVTGNEAEKVLPAVGSKAISEKIKSLEIQDCKVRVLNVDSQASFSNIVVQVIGEMSNKNQPRHKFVQTFVLAEQPNGYYVLNDIFRYLSDDDDEIIDDEVAQGEVSTSAPLTPAESGVEAPHEEIVHTDSVAHQTKQDSEKGEDDQPAAEAGQLKVEEPEPAAEKVAGSDSGVEVVDDFAEPAIADAPGETTEAASQVEDSKDGPAAEQETANVEPEKATTPAPAPAPAPAPEAPPAKKTWASMLGSNTAAATPAAPAIPALPVKQSAPQQAKVPRPVSQAQPSKTPPTEPSAAPSSTSGQTNGWQMAGDNKKGKGGPQARSSDGNVLAYIKNVNEKVDARTLREVLEQYGELKYFDVSRPRNCAFVEFATPEGYAAAVAANPHTVNTETIQVEERKPRPGAYGGPGNAQFARAPAQPGSRGRGGNMNQRTNSQSGLPKDAGRGGSQQQQQQQRGNKSGTFTPRGRGQAQAAQAD